MALWGKEDKTTARPKSVKLKTNGTIAQDSSGKKLVYLSKEEAIANASKGASGAGWYTVLTTKKGTAEERTRLELLIAISDENRASVSIVEFTETHALNTNAAIYQDAEKGTEDPEGRPGWYFTNTSVGKKVNWYFYDGSDNITLGNFSAYAVVTSDDISNDNAPFFGVYTARQSDGLDAASWYRSRRVYIINTAITPGTKYLIHIGSDPDVYPELPRIQLSLSPVAGSNRGPQTASEIVSTTSLGSNSASPVGRVKFVVEAIGVVSPTVKRDIELRLDVSDVTEDDAGLE